MGCFLGCFGFTKKQKRIKPCNKFQVHKKYVPLDSEKANVADSANSEPRDNPKEASNQKVKKKVSFNLNVNAYERIQDDDNDTTCISDDEEKTQWEFDEKETAKASMSLYPSSYRYYNCNDEEDEIRLEESDIDDEEDYGFSDDEEEEDDEETENMFGNDKKLKNDDESNEVRGNSVLLPVENLTQWKAVKARGAQQVKHQKENLVKQDGKPDIFSIQDCTELKKPRAQPQTCELSVDSSLSNWLVSAGAKDQPLVLNEVSNVI